MILSPQECLLEVPENEQIKEQQICHREAIKKVILTKIHESLRNRKFFFLTTRGYCDDYFFIAFPHYFDKHEKIFQEVKNEMEQQGWLCSPQESSCAYGTYYLFMLWSKEFNASTIEFSTTNSPTEFIYNSKNN